MKTTILSILALFAFLNPSKAQVTIQCPADLTVDLFNLDQDYESYGDAVVNSVSGQHTVDKQVTVIDSNCDGQTITLKYVATENNTTNTAFCIQEITVNEAELSDVIWPAATYELAVGAPGDLDPNISLSRPEPYDLLFGGSSIAIAHADQIIQANVNAPYKVVRTWTAIDWCSSETASFVQVLKITTLESGSVSILDIETCHGTTTSVQEVNVTTNQNGYTLDLSNCSSINNNLLGFLNCIAENNDLESTSKIMLDIVGNDDPLNGVSTLDMVITQRHILGITPFTNECNILAADLTNDGRVTAVDILTMRKLILGIVPSLPFSPSWIFINEADVSKGLNFAKSEFPLQSLRVKAIKIGDVNGSAAN